LAAGVSVIYQVSMGPSNSAATVQAMPEIGNKHLAFYPDGSSSGALLELQLGENVRYIRVDWLTGEAHFLAGAALQPRLEREQG